MLNGLPILGGLTAALLGWWWYEARLLARHRSAIPVRVHVNGTRGKSSVTRLIAGGLRAGGRRTLAKVTGTRPRVILPDGHEVPVFRPAGAHLLEQLRVLRAAAEVGAEALVIECMAVDPRLQRVSEQRMVRATHGVITNARPDHLDVMGPTPRDVARALAGTVPEGGTLFTAEHTHLDLFTAVAAQRRTRLVAVGAAEIAAISPAELAGFSHLEHPENVALALAVLLDLGIERGVALAGMQAAPPDPGALQILTLPPPPGADDLAPLPDHLAPLPDHLAPLPDDQPDPAAPDRHPVHWVNAFATNDPESTLTVHALAQARTGAAHTVLVFNARADRVPRSLQFGPVLARFPGALGVVVVGEAQDAFVRAARAAGWPAAQLRQHAGAAAAGVVAAVDAARRLWWPAAAKGPCMVLGMGNIGGLGLGLWQHLSDLARPVATAGASSEGAP